MGNPIRRKLKRAQSPAEEANVLERYISGTADAARCRQAWVGYRKFGRHRGPKDAAFTYEQLKGGSMDFCARVQVIITALRAES